MKLTFKELALFNELALAVRRNEVDRLGWLSDDDLDTLNSILERITTEVDTVRANGRAKEQP